MKTKTVVIAKCVLCGTKKEVGPNEVPEGQMPVCPNCFGIMIAVKAKGKR